MVSTVLRRLAAIELGGIGVVLGGKFSRTIVANACPFRSLLGPLLRQLLGCF